MECFRIVSKDWQGAAFDGEGARLYGGRWNNKGTSVVYAAASRALAILELLVHAESDELIEAEFVLYTVSIDDDYILSLGDNLPTGWRHFPAPESTKLIGDQWVLQSASAVLEVPSVIVPQEFNFLLNPAHPDFIQHASISAPAAVNMDERLV